MANEVQGRNSDNYLQRSKLHELLLKHFTAEELNTICFSLGIEYDDLPGKGRAGKARELVKHLDSLGRMHELINLAKNLRPNGQWDSVLLIADSIIHKIPIERTDEVYSNVGLSYLWGITLVLVIVLTVSFLRLSQFNSEMKCDRQIFADPPRYIRVGFYGANGKAYGKVTCDNILDGRTDYLAVTLQSFREENDGESGVILVVNRLNLQQSELLSFEIKGEHGREELGIKLKNVDGIEKVVWLNNNLPKEGVKTNWTLITIPLSSFLGVADRPLESITFFSDGRAGLEPQTFYVSRIEFE